MENANDQIQFTPQDQSLLEEIKSLGFTNENEVLIEMGFTDLRRNSKYLQRFQGNVDLASSLLQSKILDHSEDEAPIPDDVRSKQGDKRNKGVTKYKERLAQNLEEIKQLGYEEQIKTLESKGYFKLNKNLKALKKANGDVDKVLARYEEKDSKKKLVKEKREKESLEEIKKLGYEDLNKKLFEQGFTKLKKNLKFLKKYNGDLEKVAEELKGKQIEKKHEKKVRAPQVPVVEYTDLPETITRVYLDGNNMLFCEDAIRKACLRRKKRAGEIAIADIAWEYLAKLKRFHVVLVYDRTGLKIQKKLQEGDKTFDYTVLSAAPKYQISDDALVDWAKELGSEAKNSLFVTADRELQRRLVEAGVTDIMKPGKWLKMAKSVIGEEKYVSLLPTVSQEENKDN